MGKGHQVGMFVNDATKIAYMLHYKNNVTAFVCLICGPEQLH